MWVQNNLKMLCLFTFRGILLVLFLLMYLFMNTTHYFLTFIENYKIEARYENNLIFKKSMVSIILLHVMCIYKLHGLFQFFSSRFFQDIFPDWQRRPSCCKSQDYFSSIMSMLCWQTLF